MTKEERSELESLCKTLDTVPCGTPEWDKAYDRYCELRAKEREEYKASHIDDLRRFYDEHIAGRDWSEIDPEAWDWYSDYHKDVFGYRPKTINFGELEGTI
jgi:hypothetical protein